jgi:hypothetical protein
MEELHDIFQLPLSTKALQQYYILLEELESLDSVSETDTWTYIWVQINTKPTQL